MGVDEIVNRSWQAITAKSKQWGGGDSWTERAKDNKRSCTRKERNTQMMIDREYKSMLEGRIAEYNMNAQMIWMEEE